MSKILFFNRSPPLPACTAEGENKVGDFTILDQRYPNHRSMLSPLWMESPFFFDAHEFSSIEHAYQYHKAMLFFPDQAPRYARTGDLGCKNPLEARRSMSRNVKPMNRMQMAHWKKISEGILCQLALAQYGQDHHMALMLQATGDAELWHVFGGKCERYRWLEKVRGIKD